MLVASINSQLATWSPATLYGAAAGILIIGVLIGILIFRQRGHRAIAQRLSVLASRLAVEPHRDDGGVESHSATSKR